MDSFFFTGVQKKNSYILWLMESNSLKYFSIQTEHSIGLKFGMYIIREIGCIYFGKFRIISFSKGVKKEFFYITAYGIKF